MDLFFKIRTKSGLEHLQILKDGVWYWNKWETSLNCQTVNLCRSQDRSAPGTHSVSINIWNFLLKFLLKKIVLKFSNVSSIWKYISSTVPYAHCYFLESVLWPMTAICMRKQWSERHTVICGFICTCHAAVGTGEFPLLKPGLSWPYAWKVFPFDWERVWFQQHPAKTSPSNAKKKIW